GSAVEGLPALREASFRKPLREAWRLLRCFERLPRFRVRLLAVLLGFASTDSAGPDPAPPTVDGTHLADALPLGAHVRRARIAVLVEHVRPSLRARPPQPDTDQRPDGTPLVGGIE